MNIKFFYLYVLFLCCFNCKSPSSTLYVGTYTNGDSQGIYHYQFNSKTGKLTKPQVAANSENPSFLVYSPDKKYIYAVNETEKGAVSAFKVNSDKSLTLIDKVSTHGADPCHVAINQRGDMAVVSNYTGGTFSLHSLTEDGALNEAFQILDHTSDSLRSHAHSAQFFDKDLYASNLGLNAVFQYQLTNGNFELVSASIADIEANSGPRHFSLTKDGQFIYIINELSNTITSAKKTGSGFELIETVSTLKDDFKGESYCADIHLSEDEHFLYGSNRGENSIVVFKRDASSGRLSKIQNISSHGDWPRNFTIDPSGRFLLVAHQRSNNIAVFKINDTSGKLSFLYDVPLPSPVCLLF